MNTVRNISFAEKRSSHLTKFWKLKYLNLKLIFDILVTYQLVTLPMRSAKIYNYLKLNTHFLIIFKCFRHYLKCNVDKNRIFKHIKKI